jgi:hypothetical protein
MIFIAAGITPGRERETRHVFSKYQKVYNGHRQIDGRFESVRDQCSLVIYKRWRPFVRKDRREQTTFGQTDDAKLQNAKGCTI